MSGLTHSTGVNPCRRSSTSASTDIGTLTDMRTGAPDEARRPRSAPATARAPPGLERRRIPHGRRRAARSVVREPQRGCSDSFITSSAKRRAWSASSTIRQPEHAPGNSTTAAIRKPFGYAFRPVRNDQLNALFKYTYFYNMPTATSHGERLRREFYRSRRPYLRPHAALDRRRYARRIGEMGLRDDRRSSFNPENLLCCAPTSALPRGWEEA
jgi:hypothetical protein